MVNDTEDLDPSGAVWPLGLGTIDRIDAELGYEPGNVCLLMWSLNTLRRGRASDQPLLDFLRNISPECIARVDRLVSQVSRCGKAAGDCVALLTCAANYLVDWCP